MPKKIGSKGVRKPISGENLPYRSGAKKLAYTPSTATPLQTVARKK